MGYSDISNEDLGKMIDNVLNGNPAKMGINSDSTYIDEKAEAFIQSLKDMVK